MRVPRELAMTCMHTCFVFSLGCISLFDDSTNPTRNQPDFPGLHKLLSDAIASLGGAVFPKLNWSCPKVGGERLLPDAQ